ncbi:MAG: hypothetical protein OSB55_14220 [Verrucomicrobiota bacterium]|nr:hypothetical protein [Verrucomicrobiota bacterium]MDP6305793.1 hypothetical protein [Verrucomicrobiota bacterium]MDP6915814.1 hypothetical protein [Verrucomicrobiota bacterium]
MNTGGLALRAGSFEFVRTAGAAVATFRLAKRLGYSSQSIFTAP